MEEEKINVLVVEDEASIRKFISINLNREGFAVVEADSGEAAIEMVKIFQPAVIILDVMLPGIDGFEVCTQIREKMPNAVIIMLTARSQDMDKIMGLELGADDYMIKPFNPLELIARIRANLRKMQKVAVIRDQWISFAGLKLDLDGQRFYKKNIEIELTPTEFAIMKVLMKNPGKAYSRDDILNLVWGENYFGDMKTVDVHIRRLREKIEDNPSDPQYIETVWGFGYRLRRDQ
ncbi:response regulator transcription factor [Geosporobacter ferrireducens]|uniref:Stage 0 sporulation protein A homolog n=1 Tax=Geosporobacter ferrireducens TaxID=1424294 RepID=A0A1D8GBA6_9FIRM|nr:response regulator transcription factor [Geosporobacter ferrireducens]AOT68195.1 DNA-binding response regulator [Geosporobacter ferrireducens]MTI54245.1 response regulator transcription factor [Geosporobacter ferrireducens]